MKSKALQSFRRPPFTLLALSAFGIYLHYWASGANAEFAPQVLYELQPPAGVTVSNLGANDIASGQAVGAGAGVGTGNAYHAFLWNGSGNAIDLHPSGYSSSTFSGTDGISQVGEGTTLPNQTNTHAILWRATPGSAIDLNPSGFATSTAIAVSGSQQVGFAFLSSSPSTYHAIVWNGTAASAVDLNPTGFTDSHGTGTDGTHQVGWGVIGTVQHALLWTGQANTAVDLNPTNLGFSFSNATGVGGGQQVGFASQGNADFAMLWTGSAGSAVNLNPSGFITSAAYATNGLDQVGYARTPGILDQAFVWSGSATSGVNLGVLLPSFLIYSRAYSIDPAGNIYGLANDAAGNTFAVEWVAVPEPAWCVLCPGSLLLLLQRRRLD